MVSYTNGDCWSYLMSLVKHPVSVGLQLCIKRPENEQTDLTAGEISSSLLEVMGKGAAGKTMCCSLLPGITNSAVLSSTLQGTQTSQVPVSVSQNSVFAGSQGYLDS